VHGKFTNRVHKHGGFLLLALYRDTVPLTVISPSVCLIIC